MLSPVPVATSPVASHSGDLVCRRRDERLTVRNRAARHLFKLSRCVLVWMFTAAPLPTCSTPHTPPPRRARLPLYARSRACHLLLRALERVPTTVLLDRRRRTKPANPTFHITPHAILRASIDSRAIQSDPCAIVNSSEHPVPSSTPPFCRRSSSPSFGLADVGEDGRLPVR